MRKNKLSKMIGAIVMMMMVLISCVQPLCVPGQPCYPGGASAITIAEKTPVPIQTLPPINITITNPGGNGSTPVTTTPPQNTQTNQPVVTTPPVTVVNPTPLPVQPGPIVQQPATGTITVPSTPGGATVGSTNDLKISFANGQLRIMFGTFMMGHSGSIINPITPNLFINRWTEEHALMGYWEVGTNTVVFNVGNSIVAGDVGNVYFGPTHPSANGNWLWLEGATTLPVTPTTGPLAGTLVTTVTIQGDTNPDATSKKQLHFW